MGGRSFSFFAAATSALLLIACTDQGELEPIGTETVPTPTVESTSVTPEPTSTPAPTATSLPAPTAVPPTPSPTPQPTSTPQPTPSPTALPTATPTPEPVGVADIFARISPSVPKVENPAGFGSGIYIDGGFVITNAHVVWPYDTVDLIFTDDVKFLDIPVVGIDTITDLAIIGPIESDRTPLQLSDSEDHPVGSETLLIGYPGELEAEPRPTLSSGLISNVREWEDGGITYFQSDHVSTGGQSGGALVSKEGEVIGISTLQITSALFTLSVSAADARELVDEMLARNPDLESRSWLTPDVVGSEVVDRKLSHEFEIKDEYDSQGFVIDQPPEILELTLTQTGSGQDVWLLVSDSEGETVGFSDVLGPGDEEITAPISWWEPHFVSVSGYEPVSSTYVIECNCGLRPVRESDDVRALSLDGIYSGRLDYPGDTDHFEIELTEGQSVDVHSEAILFDPFVAIGWVGGPPNLVATDDDSGGGLLGTFAEGAFTAPHTGTFSIGITDVSFSGVGGYSVAVRLKEPFDDPPPPLTNPVFEIVDSPLGQMMVFEGISVPFTAEIPADWLRQGANPAVPQDIDQYGPSLRSPSITFVEDPVASDYVQGEYTARNYADGVANAFETLGLSEVISQRYSTPGVRTEIAILEMKAINGLVTSTLYYVHNNDVLVQLNFSGTQEQMDEISDVIDHAFASFAVTE